MLTSGARVGVITALNVTLAVSGSGQTTLECSVTVMMSPGLLAALRNVESAGCGDTRIPFTLQSNVGAAPPLVVLALKVTGRPWHCGDGFWVTEIVGVLDGVTDITTCAIAESGATQPVAVILTFTISPFVSVLVTKGSPINANVPFTYHWYVGAPPPFVGVGGSLANCS